MEGLTIRSDDDSDHGDHEPVDPLTLKFQELRKRYHCALDFWFLPRMKLHFKRFLRFRVSSSCVLTTLLDVNSTASFTAIDKNFLRPFFTKEDKRRNSTDKAPNGMFTRSNFLFSQMLCDRFLKSSDCSNVICMIDFIVLFFGQERGQQTSRGSHLKPQVIVEPLARVQVFLFRMIWNMGYPMCHGPGEMYKIELTP